MNASMDIKTEAYDLIAQFAGQANVLTIPRAFIAMTGSIETALLLSQIIYWTERTDDEGGWIAKSYEEWQVELTLTKYQIMKAMKVLFYWGVETKLKKWNGAPTVHYRMNKALFLQSIVKFFNNPLLSNLTIQSEKTLQSYTETTSETTSEKKEKESFLLEGPVGISKRGDSINTENENTADVSAASAPPDASSIKSLEEREAMAAWIEAEIDELRNKFYSSRQKKKK